MAKAKSYGNRTAVPATREASRRFYAKKIAAKLKDGKPLTGGESGEVGDPAISP
jgi:hypothetical protein